MVHQKTEKTKSTPDALIALEDAQTDRYIIAAESLGRTVLPSQDTMDAYIDHWRNAAKHK
jgi:hypothetical protein